MLSFDGNLGSIFIVIRFRGVGEVIFIKYCFVVSSDNLFMVINDGEICKLNKKLIVSF